MTINDNIGLYSKMITENTAITVDGISKVYRLGVKDLSADSLGGALMNVVRSPWKNYKKYRSLYRFDDIDGEPFQDTDDILWALKNVSFQIQKGDVVGIIGGNGAGKSTLLKILSRITDPTRGECQIRGRVSSLLEVGTGFHNELTGRENVYLNGTILGMKKKEIDRKFDAIVDFSGVEKFLDTPVKRYSSGMKVRLAFAVAAHLEPEILIIDEVLAVGDTSFQKKCIDKMESVGQEGRTVLFVSHNMPAVTRLCERAILLEQGRVVDDGTSYDIVRGYLNAGHTTMAERVWKDPDYAPSGDVMRLRAARVRNEDGHVSETHDVRRPLSIEMEYDVLKSGHTLLPHFGLITETGRCAFVTVDLDPKWRKRPRPEGRYISLVRIPGNLLSEGMTYVNCFGITLDPDRKQFLERNVVAFQTVDSHEGDTARGDYTHNFPGVVRPLLKWETKVL